MKRWRRGSRRRRSSRSRRRRGSPSGSRRGSSARGRAEGESRLVDFPLVNSREALLWMVQMHCIDMNAWYSRVDKPERPDYVLFDLDPPEERGRVRAVHPRCAPTCARRSRSSTSVVREDERRRRASTSLVPIARRSAFDETYEFAELLSRRLEAEHPGEVTTEWLKRKRRGCARRPPPERARQDDRVGVLGAAEARRAGVDAAALGGADGGRARRATSRWRSRSTRVESTATCSSPCCTRGQALGPALKALRA